MSSLIIRSSLILVLLAASNGVSDQVFTPANEFVAGQLELSRFLAKADLLEDLEVTERVNRIGQSVAKASDRPDLPYAFYVTTDATKPQARSFAGGTVVMNQLLVEKILFSTGGDNSEEDADDRLAFALAHEVAHISLRHHFRDQRERVHLEMEADRYGALYAVRAGYRLNAADEVLQLMAKYHKGLQPRREALLPFRDELERSAKKFEVGLQAIDDGNYNQAIQTIELFVRQFPNSFSGRVNLGTAYLASWISLNGSRDGLMHPWPVLNDSGIRIRGNVGSNYLTRAANHYAQAMALNPTAREPYLGLAIIKMQRGQLEEAAELLDRAGETYRQSEMARKNLSMETDANWLLLKGNLLALQGDDVAAQAFYRRALELRANWSPARDNLNLIALR